MSILVRGLIVLGAMLLILSCGMVARPGEEFGTATRDYVQRLRWMDLAGASGHYSEEYRAGFLRRLGELKDLHVVDVRLESADLQEEAGRADTTIILEYYLLPSATVRQFVLPQEWAYQGGDRYHAGTWRIVSPFPDFP